MDVLSQDRTFTTDCSIISEEHNQSHIEQERTSYTEYEVDA